MAKAICRAGFAFARFNTHLRPVIEFNTGIALTQKLADEVPSILKFELDHKRGSLAAILNVLSDCKLNLTKIQSMPMIQTPWRYSFFVDVTFDKLNDYFKAKSIIEIMAKDFKVLGEYKNSKDD